MANVALFVSSSIRIVAGTVNVGVSATAATSTAIVSLRTDASRFADSVAVATTVSVKSTSLSAGGVILRLARFQPVTSTFVLPMLPVNV